MADYKAIVAKIDRVVPIPGADRIHTAYVLGEQVVVAKDWGVGKEGLFFPADTQLSEDFCHHNNLYRDVAKNRRNDSKGFFDDNRRVRCQPFLKVRSEGFFCGLDSLGFIGQEFVETLKVGDQLSQLNGVEICQKYVNEKTARALANAQKHGAKKLKLCEAPLFHKHVDTQQFKYFVDKVPVGALLSFHAKVHGTSARYSHSLVKRNFANPMEKVTELLKRIGLRNITKHIAYIRFHDKVADLTKKASKLRKPSWEYLAGTRNVVLFEDKKDKEGFHGSEQFRFDILEKLKPYLEKGMTVYGEIAGYANDKPIMGRHNMSALKDKAYSKKYGKDDFVYKYGCPEGEKRFHIYRITYTNADGQELDFTDAQIKAWCEKRGFLATYDVVQPFIYDGDSEGLADLVERLTERPNVLTEDYIDPSHISEGIIIRVDHDTQVPVFYKSKSYAFKVLEGIVKESGEVDLEEAS